MLTDPILITGASGMLGHALEARLRELGAGKLLTPTSRELDLRDYDSVRAYWLKHRPVRVFHLAGFVRGILGNMRAGNMPFLANGLIQTNLMHAAIEYPPQALVVAGTVAAYGFPYVRLPLREEDFWRGLPHSGEGPYALGKRAAIPYLEGLAFMGSGTRFAILTNLFGDHDHFNDEGAHVVPALISRFVDAQAKQSPSVTVWGRPDTSRDFLDSRDAAQHLIDLAESAFASRGFALVNVASGQETTMGELAGIIAEESGFKGSIVWDSAAPVGVANRSIDVSRLRAESRHTPRALRTALRDTVEWYKSRPHVT